MNMRKGILALGLSTVFISTMLQPLRVNAQSTQSISVHKSVRTTENDIFSIRADNIRDRQTVEFMIVIQNLGTAPLPQVRIVDTLPNRMVYLASETPPDDQVSNSDNTSFLWIVRALEPNEQRIIKYQAKVDFIAEDSGSCFNNVANLVYQNKVQDSSGVEVCVVGGDNVLGSTTTQPDTAIFGSSLIDISLAMTMFGATLVFLTNQLQVIRFKRMKVRKIYLY
jgi:hypothetical protein